MTAPLAYFITWTTYGSWLPGDARHWRKWRSGARPPQPRLEAWCRQLMKDAPIVLSESQRKRIEAVCQEHAAFKGWALHAVSARSNHVHLAVTAGARPQLVRDQFKANSTRVLRQSPEPVIQEHVWTRGGDIEFIDREDDLELVVLYMNEAQDRKSRDD